MLSLFADQEREAKLDSLGDPLALLDKHVDFAALAAEIDRWAPRPSRAKGGRPPYPTELMTRLLVLQQLFNLSDEQIRGYHDGPRERWLKMIGWRPAQGPGRQAHQ